MDEKQLYAMPSKFSFGFQEVEYLGHIVSHEVVKVDPNKIRSIMECPILKILNNIRGLLWLTCYYHKLVKNYVKIEAPLVVLLKGGILLDSTSNQIFWET